MDREIFLKCRQIYSMSFFAIEVSKFLYLKCVNENKNFNKQKHAHKNFLRAITLIITEKKI